MKEARFWTPEEGDKVRCSLCSHRCLVPNGKRGICGVRENNGGKMHSLIYGQASSMTPDPIEKKPLYHFHPGTRVFSLGSVGCNFACLNCQNHSISQVGYDDAPLRKLTPKEVVKMARKTKCQGIAWTYNEPTIWHEFAYDASKLAKAQDMYVAYVTNGFMTPEALRDIAPYLDAMNIDVKSFSDEFYKRVSKGRLQPVLDTCALARELGLHVELTYLVIPGLNDSPEELGKFSTWAVNKLGPDTPVHFSRFHPQFKMSRTPHTPLRTLNAAYETAKAAGLRYVYLGNVPRDSRESTYCHHCQALAVERLGYTTRDHRTPSGGCPGCGAELPIIGGCK